MGIRSFYRVEVVLIVALAMAAPVWAQPWDGSGTEGDPYLIYDADDMQRIGADPCYWEAHFKLMGDIDLAGFTGRDFNIIGNNTTKFTGSFDGDGYAISNFSYSTTGMNFIGLFGYVGSEGEIKNLGMVNVDIDAGTGDNVGGLAGRNYGTVSQCYATGAVAGDDGGHSQGGGAYGGDHRPHAHVLPGRLEGAAGAVFDERCRARWPEDDREAASVCLRRSISPCLAEPG